jgi:hypothetical protein
MENANEALMAELEKIRAEDAANKKAASEQTQPLAEEVVETTTQTSTETSAETPAEMNVDSSTETTTETNVDTNTSTEQSPATEPKKSLKDLIAEEEAQEARVMRLKEIEELEKDEFVKLVLDAKKNGKDARAIISEMMDINPDKVSEEDLFYMTLDTNMSDDEKQEEYESFQRLSQGFRDRVIEQQREKIRGAQSEKLKALMGSGQNFDAKPAFNEATVGLDAALEKLQGKEYKGIELTPQRLLELRKEAMKFFGAFTNMENKTIDYNEALETAFARKALGTWSDDIKKAGKNEGKIEAFKEIHNPSAMRSVSSAQNKGQKDSQAEIDAIYQRLMNAQTTIR